MSNLEDMKFNAKYFADALYEAIYEGGDPIPQSEILELIQVLEFFASGGVDVNIKLTGRELKIEKTITSPITKLVWRRIVTFDELPEMSFFDIAHFYQGSDFADGRKKGWLSAAAINKHLKSIRKHIDRSEYDFKISVQKKLVSWQVFRGKAVTRSV